MVLECKEVFFYNENHPLGLVIDDEGIYGGCRVHERKITLIGIIDLKNSKK